jgi:3-deoxy-D-manno-octulosonic-acid transferase
VRDTEIILVAGSIHPKEEKIVIGAYDFLKNNARYPVRLIVVPRYNHFIPRIIAELDKFGYKHVLRSCLGQKEFSPEDVVIVDTFGELAYLYALSSVIVVGGSFIKRNPCGFGQNIVEPLLNIKPVFFGPYMGQFREITSDILQIYAGAQANSSHQLGENIVNLLNDGGLTKSVLSRMRGIVAENSQSIKTHADLIANLVKNGNGA